jgi:DNA helicase-2/ATP-dependent DNA helicase PcrA
MEEERRLLYVGVTRAKDQLFLVYTQNRSAFGYQEPSIPSRFLDAIPAELLQGSGALQAPSRTTTGRQPPSWEAVRTKPAAQFNRSIEYPAGTRVQHPVWGEGMVLSSKYQDDDEVVDIFFEEVGLKRVVASLAKLQIL